MVAATIMPGSDLVIKHVGINPTRTGVIDILRIENGEVVDHWVVNNMVGTLMTGQRQPE